MISVPEASIGLWTVELGDVRGVRGGRGRM